MSKVWHLGPDEVSALDVLNALELGTGFESCYIISEHQKSLEEIRLRLAAQAADLYQKTPSANIAQEIDELAHKLPPGSPRAIAWVECRPYDQATWASALASLNIHRDWYRKTFPGLLVLAGPEDLIPLVTEYAPDFWSIRSLVRIFKYKPTLAKAGTKMKWLHLSDLHFKPTERWEQKRTLEALLRELQEEQDQGWQPDFLFITGDIAYSGESAEYKRAEEFLRTLMEKLHLEQSRVFIVPGNHDVCRGAIKRADELIL